MPPTVSVKGWTARNDSRGFGRARVVLNGCTVHALNDLTDFKAGFLSWPAPCIRFHRYRVALEGFKTTEGVFEPSCQHRLAKRDIMRPVVSAGWPVEKGPLWVCKS